MPGFNMRRDETVVGPRLGAGRFGTWFSARIPLLYVSSYPGQLSLTIPQWVDAMSTGNGIGHREKRNSEFCLTVGPRA